MVKFEIITPKEYQEIFCGFHSTPFGKCFIEMTEKGICHLSFVNDKEALAIAVGNRAKKGYSCL